MDLLKINKKQSLKIIEMGVLLDQLLTKSNKGREPIYIEILLNQLLI